MSKRKQILKQMFDVRPTQSDGSLDMKRIKHLKKTVVISVENIAKQQKIYKKFSDIALTARIEYKPKRVSEFWTNETRIEETQTAGRKFGRRTKIIQLGQTVSDDLLSISRVTERQTIAGHKPNSKTEESIEYTPSDSKSEYFFESTESLQANLEKSTETLVNIIKKGRKRSRRKREGKSSYWTEKNIKFSFSNFLAGRKIIYGYHFVTALLIFSLLIPSFSLLQKGLTAKSAVLSQSQRALGQFAQAKDNLSSGQLDRAAVNFEESYELLSEAHQDISEIGGKFSEILRFIPGISKVASANYLLAAGENMALSGKYLATSVKSVNQIKNPLTNMESADQPALTDIFISLRDGVESADKELQQAQENLDKVNLDDLPEEIRSTFSDLRNKLPLVTGSIQSFLNYSQIFLDVLGYHGPRKFLFLFQNNQEMRATGGFIGSYGILDISNGRIKNLFVDDIYNPDGQLHSRIIPPEPIQKMSAAWTMHDANWFPDFPTSAEKVSWFYEKTGGPTVDGIISITPNLLQDLLVITGPIEMPNYDTTVDESNFVEKTQYEVEIDYDKELNRPKKFIADLTPKILDKIFSSKDFHQMIRILSALNKSLREKHLMLYSKNYNIQKLISEQGWSGEMQSANKDFLSVINTNISGYKTDGVIDETITHSCEIQEDGSIVDTVSVTRKHNGGNKEQDWWNRVNSDYIRVYVPEGSTLLEANGQTREFVSPPLDYHSLGFKKDPQIQAVEDSTRVDEKTGTHIYSENHKTVFANWTYVSPGETMVLEYKYRLPFKLNFDNLHHPADSFSILYQKQSGSPGSKLMSEIKIPENYRSIWRYPDDASYDFGKLIMKTALNQDKFVGVTLEKNP